jgi:hypothetical protein
LRGLQPSSRSVTHYGVLGSMADRDAELATQLQPVIDFMKVGRRKPEPEPEPTPEPTP